MDALLFVKHNPSALLLMSLGIGLTIWGIHRGRNAWRRHSGDPLKASTLVRGYRIAIIGVCLGVYGLGWWWRLETVMTVALVICLEEIAESSFYVAALKRAPA